MVTDCSALLVDDNGICDETVCGFWTPIIIAGTNWLSESLSDFAPKLLSFEEDIGFAWLKFIFSGRENFKLFDEVIVFVNNLTAEPAADIEDDEIVDPDDPQQIFPLGDWIATGEALNWKGYI